MQSHHNALSICAIVSMSGSNADLQREYWVVEGPQAWWGAGASSPSSTYYRTVCKNITMWWACISNVPAFRTAHWHMAKELLRQHTKEMFSVKSWFGETVKIVGQLGLRSCEIDQFKSTTFHARYLGYLVHVIVKIKEQLHTCYSSLLFCHSQVWSCLKHSIKNVIWLEEV